MSRGRLALALGSVTYVAAWAFGSRPLYPVAVGLLLAAAGGRLWVRVAGAPVRLTRWFGRGEHAEGDDVWVTLTLERESRVPLGTAVVRERISRIGERETRVRRRGGRLEGGYVLERVPRGRYVFEHAEVVVEDPFGLERVTMAVAAGGAVVVHPRLVELDALFSESGAHAQGGRRLLLRRPSGFDLHSVREHQEGESLRGVHWRSTAKRGVLMVKELEDAPRDEVAVVLDAAAGATAGESFEAQVRAAGSILRSHARRGRRAVLVCAGARTESVRVSSEDGDWGAALDLLAAAEPDGTRPLADVVTGEGAAAQALELVVVTARLEHRLVDRLTRRTHSHRGASLVFVDTASFAGRRSRPEPELLRLQAAGVQVAVVRRGDDLRAALGLRRAAGVTRA